MKGHEYVWELRKKHKLKPKHIFINDFPCDRWVTDEKMQGALPSVVTHGEIVEGLDLRFVVGCMVTAVSPSEKRVKALFERIKTFKPKVVLALHHVNKSDWPGFEQDLWFGLWKDGEHDV